MAFWLPFLYLSDLGLAPSKRHVDGRIRTRGSSAPIGLPDKTLAVRGTSTALRWHWRGISTRGSPAMCKAYYSSRINLRNAATRRR